MQLSHPSVIQRARDRVRGFDYREIVMSLRWRASGAGNLDALCLLQATDGRVLEVIHPGHERNANGSVVHTGDSSAAPGRWNDESIFVFLDALPGEVAKLSFVAAGADSRLGRFGGAVCQFTDRISEQEIHWHELSARDMRSSVVVATLTRHGEQWRFSTEDDAAADRRLPWQFSPEGA